MPLTLFSQGSTGSSLAADPSAYTMGVQFSVGHSSCTLTGIWFFSPSGAGVLPQTIALYAVSGASLVHSETPSWSGAAGSGWVRSAFASPPALTASTSYKACVLQNTAANWYSGTAHYWDSGAGSSGITNGTLSAPNNAGGNGGQDTFTASSSLAYPATSFNATNYWVDPEITDASAHNRTAALTVTPVFSAARVRGRNRTAALTVTPVFSAAGTASVPPPPVGSWWGLDSVFKQSRQEFEAFVSRPPVACPNDGEPLRNAPTTKAGSGVVLYCPFDGWQYPRDWHPPQRP